MKKLLFYIILSITFFGCKPKFDPSDDFKEVDVVYAVLDPDADKQYVQLSRGFQTDGQNALDIAQLNDSIYHSDSILVEIIEFVNGEESKRATLKKEAFDTREEGVFTNPEHFLYSVNNSDIDIDTSSIYKVKVTNTKTGKVSFSRVETLSSFSFTGSVINNNLFYPSLVKKEKVVDGTIEIINNFKKEVLFEVSVTIPYFTRDEFNNIIDSNVIEYVATKANYGNPSNPFTEIIFNGNVFFNVIFDNVPELTNAQYSRIFGVVTVDVKCFDNEMYNYVVAEQSFNSLSQSKPFYTNVFDEKTDELQAGVVSSVKTQQLVLELNKEKDYIISTKPNLGFSL